MPAIRIRGGVLVGVLLAIAVPLAGCPMPLPSGYTAASRENIDAGMTARLQAGVSTRADVLLLLGEPDGTGPDEAWLAYGSVYGKGGVVFLLCAGGGCAGTGGEKMDYHRLVIMFDNRGLMTHAEFVDLQCWEGLFAMNSSGARSPPCLRIDAPDTAPEHGADQPDSVPRDGPVHIPADLRDFATGKAALVIPGWFSGLAAATDAAEHGPLTRELHDTGQWTELAGTILDDRYGDDLRWYYLGRAAEGMGLCDAAEIYYGISRERSARFATRCLGAACSGISLPDALQPRLRAVAALREAGQCSVYPGDPHPN